jgi:hypothetical protein
MGEYMYIVTEDYGSPKWQFMGFKNYVIFYSPMYKFTHYFTTFEENITFHCQIILN